MLFKISKKILYFLFFISLAGTLSTKSNKLSYHKPPKAKIKPKTTNATNLHIHSPVVAQKAKTTLIVYMAGDNDLFPFAGRNLNQMEKIGSNENINIFVHLDMHRPGHPKSTKHYIIEKGKRSQIGPDMCMDSGDPETLIHTIKLAVEHCPANDYMLVLWNHGTGPLEPTIRKAVNPSYLFHYNEKTKLIELDRSIGFLDYINHNNEYIEPKRGICFDDTTGNYLTNEKLKYALNICTRDIIKKKFSVIGCDACLMSTIEVASILKDFAHIMVGSQEVELGTGWDYSLVLSPYINGKPEKQHFASHIVQSYNKAYSKITHDYTQSAINLDVIAILEQNFTQITHYLIEGLKKQKNKNVRDVIKNCRNKNNCTYFDEPSYKDLHHLYINLLENIGRLELVSAQETIEWRKNLHDSLKHGCNLISQTIIDNTSGPNLKLAKGISIYFPENQIHSSYRRCEFALTTQWLQFLSLYLS